MKLKTRTRAIIAGCGWLIGSGVLFWRGIGYWIDCYHDSAGVAWAVLVAALLIGGAKGWFVLRRASARMLRHIQKSPEPRPFWETYPLYFYPLIAVMIGLGIFVRKGFGHHPLFEYMPGLVAGVYIGIGAALLASVWPFFDAARKLGTHDRAGA